MGAGQLSILSLCLSSTARHKLGSVCRSVFLLLRPRREREGDSSDSSRDSLTTGGFVENETHRIRRSDPAPRPRCARMQNSELASRVSARTHGMRSAPWRLGDLRALAHTLTRLRPQSPRTKTERDPDTDSDTRPDSLCRSLSRSLGPWQSPETLPVPAPSRLPRPSIKLYT